MAPRLLRAAALALTFALVPASAHASHKGIAHASRDDAGASHDGIAHASHDDADHASHDGIAHASHDGGGHGARGGRRGDAPPRFVTTQWLVRVAAGAPAGFLAQAIDPDGGSVTLAWAFDDGTTATGERVAKVWTVPGPHSATVTATDAGGRSASRTFTVDVVAAAEGPQPGGVSLRRPGPSPAAAARVAVAPGALRLAADGSVSVALSCAAADCAGRVSLAHGGRRLAAARYAIAAGRRAAVRLRLPADMAARLRRRPQRTVVVGLAPDGQAPARVVRALRAA
jgi:hypothetical protein